MSDNAIAQALWTAALKLAEDRPWREISLADIAEAAGLDLARAASVAGSKAELLVLFARHLDGEFLAGLARAPLEGEGHDRLFDSMLRRIEQLTPYKPALRSIARDSPEGPTDWLVMAGSTLTTQNWILEAAGLCQGGLQGDVQKLGLAAVYRDVLRVWLEDDDPGLARTMAALDRKLRSAADMTRRLSTPVAILGGLAKAVKSFRQMRRQERSASDTTAD
jgi:AcrR family transcriptional regulator